MRRWLLTVAASLAILALLWRAIDLHAIASALRSARPGWVLAGLAMVAPLTVVTAWRFCLLSRTDLSLPASLRLILAASTLNLALPSKMGDIAKAWVLHRRYGFAGERALALVVFEKMIDLGALLAWGVAALCVTARSSAALIAAGVLAVVLAVLLVALSPARAGPAVLQRASEALPRRMRPGVERFALQWAELTRWFWSDRWLGLLVALVSLALWAAHLTQVWLLARAIGPNVPWAPSLAAAALAILAGLMPFTVAGIGTRDAAIVVLFSPWLSAAGGAALGVLATSRYLVPALAGLPFASVFWTSRRSRAGLRGA
jgi:uncharacterized protein (TIRG00374 family)